eukprot:765007-Hanusia_phi.AAC.5
MAKALLRLLLLVVMLCSTTGAAGAAGAAAGVVAAGGAGAGGRGRGEGEGCLILSYDAICYQSSYLEGKEVAIRLAGGKPDTYTGDCNLRATSSEACDTIQKPVGLDNGEQRWVEPFPYSLAGVHSVCDLLADGLRDEVKLCSEDTDEPDKKEANSLATMLTDKARNSDEIRDDKPEGQGFGEEDLQDEEIDRCLDVSALILQATADEDAMATESDPDQGEHNVLGNQDQVNCLACSRSPNGRHEGLQCLVRDALDEELNMWNEELKLRDWSSQES